MLRETQSAHANHVGSLTAGNKAQRTEQMPHACVDLAFLSQPEPDHQKHLTPTDRPTFAAVSRGGRVCEHTRQM